MNFFRTTALSICLLAIGVITAAPASAHVSIDVKSAKNGSVRLAFRVPHGCEGSATHTVKIMMPEGFIGVKPAPKPGWKVETAKGPFARTYDYFHGKKLSDGVKEISWSGGALTDEMFDEFLVMGFISDAFKPGDTIAFPVTQLCEKGSLAWVEEAAPGVDPHSLKFPAPLLPVVAADNQPTPAQALTIASAWARPTPGGATVGAGYFDIKNATAAADKLLTVSSPVAARVEIHSTDRVDGIMKMRPVTDGLDIAAGSKVSLSPGGLHLMFVDLKAPLVTGQTFDVVLTFSKAGEVRVPIVVRDAAAAENPHAEHQH